MSRLPVMLIEEEKLEEISLVLKAVGHPLRLQIVNILMDGERSVKDLVRILQANQSIMSLSLNNLKIRGVLKSRRNKNVVYYSMKDSYVKNIIVSILAEI